MCEYDYIVLKQKRKEMDILEYSQVRKLNHQHFFALFLPMQLCISKKATTCLYVPVSSIYLGLI